MAAASIFSVSTKGVVTAKAVAIKGANAHSDFRFRRVKKASLAATSMIDKQILDPCCGSRMFWFDKKDARCLFGDKRKESHILCDGRSLEISPDVELDFTALPFCDEKFSLVVFDPPHLKSAGPRSWQAAKYGKLGENWQDTIKAGFAECFRVLRPSGVLIFKWNETQIPTREVLALTSEKPLFGHISGKRAATHWITFMKGGASESDK
jgi:SAM-dependent methyltransferase